MYCWGESESREHIKWLLSQTKKHSKDNINIWKQYRMAEIITALYPFSWYLQQQVDNRSTELYSIIYKIIT